MHYWGYVMERLLSGDPGRAPDRAGGARARTERVRIRSTPKR